MIVDDLRAMSREALDDWLVAQNAEAMRLRGHLEAIEAALRVGYRVLRERLVRTLVKRISLGVVLLL